MSGKRVAARQLTKSAPEDLSGSSDGEETASRDAAPIQERKISRPGGASAVARRAATISAMATPAALSNPFARACVPAAPAMVQQAGEERGAAAQDAFELERHLRGLNESFARSIREAIQAHCTADLSVFFAKYAEHLRTIQANYGGDRGAPQDGAKAGLTGLGALAPEAKEAQSFTFGSSAPKDEEKSFTFGGSASKEAKGFAFGGGASQEAKGFTVGGGAFKEEAKPFDFVRGAPKEEAKPFAFGGSALKEEAKPFTFGNSTPKEEVKPFAFGSSASQEAKGFAFGNSAPKEEAKPFAFGSSAPAVNVKPFTFGSGAAAPEAKPFTFGSGSSDAKPFTFGSGSSETKPFTFGGGAGQKEGDSALAASSAEPLKFSFSSQMPSFGGAATPTMGDDEDGIPEGEEESFAGDRTNTDLIRRGAGEEGEETLIEQRCKLYILEKESGWTDLGVAIVKVNQRGGDGEGRKSRLLARNEGSGRMAVNSWINGTVQTEHAPGKKELSIICVKEDGQLAKYLIRCKDADQAHALFGAITGAQQQP